MRLKLLILLAVLVRLTVLPFLFHADLKSQYYHANFLSEGVINVYSFIEKNKENLSYRDTFNYPPLAYFLLGAWNILIKPILGQPYLDWLKNWGDFWYTNSQIFRQLLFLKMPYLVFDLLTGFILWKIVPKEKKERVAILWFFNPLSLYIIYGLSNFDIIPTFFTLLALLLFKNEKFFWSGTSLGVGIALKLFPIFVLPFFIISLYKGQKYKQVCDFTSGVLLVPLLSLSFLFKDFLNSSSGGLLFKILDNRILLMPVFLVLYVILIIVFAKKPSSWINLNRAIVVTFFAVFLGTKIHPQWFLWVLPFLFILICENFLVLLLFLPILISYLIFTISYKDPFLTLGILSPIIPGIYESDFIKSTLFTLLSNQKPDLVAKVLLNFFVWTIILPILVKFVSGKNIFLFKEFNIWKRLNGQSLLVYLFLSVLFVFLFSFVYSVHSVSEKRLVTSQLSSNMEVPFYKDHPITQAFMVNGEGINQVYIRMKNNSVINIEPVTFRLLNDKGTVLREVVIHAVNIIGDDFVRFKFKPLEEKVPKNLLLTLNSPTHARTEAIKVETDENKQLVLKVYRKEDFGVTAGLIMKDFISRFRSDLIFVYFYSMLFILVPFLILRKFDLKNES